MRGGGREEGGNKGEGEGRKEEREEGEREEGEKEEGEVCVVKLSRRIPLQTLHCSSEVRRKGGSEAR